MHFLLAFICFTQPAAPQFTYNVTDNAKQEFSGTTDQQFQLTTSFGRAVINSDQVRSVTVSKGKHVFRFADGTTLSGKLVTDTLKLTTAEGVKEIAVADIASVSVSIPAVPVPNTIADGVADNGVTYHLHVPGNYSPEVPLPAILILHGSNMNSRAYVNTIKTAWPELSERYILIGINGERQNKNSKPDNPSYNYSYVNFMGRSTYKGYPGTDRESPALVSEVVKEIKQSVPLSKVFVGGHSQGGYLTYMLVMHYPELFAGGFPVAGGMVIQANPTAFADEELRIEQRKIPIAIIHAPNDPVVKYSMSSSAFKSFVGDGFPMVRLIDDTQAGHMFANLPIDRAIEWLETMTSDVPTELLDSANTLWKAGQFHNSIGLTNRLHKMKLDEAGTAQLKKFDAIVSGRVAETANDLLELITNNADGSWVEDYHKFHANFAYAQDAKLVVAAYQELSRLHKDSGNKLYGEARRLFQQQKRDEGYAKCQEIVDKYYASSRYRTVKTWLDNRKKDDK